MKYVCFNKMIYKTYYNQNFNRYKFKNKQCKY